MMMMMMVVVVVVVVVAAVLSKTSGSHSIFPMQRVSATTNCHEAHSEPGKMKPVQKK